MPYLFFFFFTPDTSKSVEEQIRDEVTGIYVARKIQEGWTEPERVWLQAPGKLSLDGCQFVQGDQIWFCTAREGLTGVHWFHAEQDGDDAVNWKNWRPVDFPETYEVGELHFSKDLKEMFFHSRRAGGAGGLDIWMSTYKNGGWQQPINISPVNSDADEGWPALSADGSRLN
jgi:hypothetical protein